MKKNIALVLTGALLGIGGTVFHYRTTHARITKAIPVAAFVGCMNTFGLLCESLGDCDPEKYKPICSGVVNQMMTSKK